MPKSTAALFYVTSQLPASIAARIRVCASGCWEWQGSRNQEGYGRLEWQGRRLYAHRLVFTLLCEPIPHGLVIDHLCRNRPCCNPAHLEAVTRTQNSLRAVQAYRIPAPAAETPDYPGRMAEMEARASGLPDHIIAALSPEIARNIRVNPGTGCWEWQGQLNQHGYGRVRWRGRKWLAHRTTWTILRSEVPAGLVLDHLCRNPACTCPDHLEPVTPQENTLRGQTIAAAFARRDRCDKGHEFTIRVVNGKERRICDACSNASSRAAFKRRYGADAEFTERHRTRARERQRRKRAEAKAAQEAA